MLTKADCERIRAAIKSGERIHFATLGCALDTHQDGDCGSPACPICGEHGLNAKIAEALR